jgi:hypothetical protein
MMLIRRNKEYIAIAVLGIIILFTVYFTMFRM